KSKPKPLTGKAAIRSYSKTFSKYVWKIMLIPGASSANVAYTFSAAAITSSLTFVEKTGSSICTQVAPASCSSCKICTYKGKNVSTNPENSSASYPFDNCKYVIGPKITGFPSMPNLSFASL